MVQSLCHSWSEEHHCDVWDGGYKGKNSLLTRSFVDERILFQLKAGLINEFFTNPIGYKWTTYVAACFTAILFSGRIYGLK